MEVIVKLSLHKALYRISSAFLLVMAGVDVFLLPHNMDMGTIPFRNTAAFYLSLFTLIPISWDLITRLPKFLGLWVSIELWMMVLLGYSRYEYVRYSNWFFPAIFGHFARGFVFQLFAPLFFFLPCLTPV